jgi:hypothetical protein
MADQTASEAGKTLAALRHRATFTCEICGAEYEAWVRARQQARTCSPKCRQKLHRRRQKQQRPD